MHSQWYSDVFDFESAQEVWKVVFLWIYCFSSGMTWKPITIILIFFFLPLKAFKLTKLRSNRADGTLRPWNYKLVSNQTFYWIINKALGFRYETFLKMLLVPSTTFTYMPSTFQPVHIFAINLFLLSIEASSHYRPLMMTKIERKKQFGLLPKTTMSQQVLGVTWPFKVWSRKKKIQAKSGGQSKIFLVIEHVARGLVPL